MSRLALEAMIAQPDAWQPRHPDGDGRRTRCACPPWRRRCRQAVRAAKSGAWRCCELLLSEAGHAAARRADQPPRCRIGRLARAAPRSDYPGTRHRRHPRPLLPRQRRRAGSSNSTAATASRTRATTRRGSSRRPSALERRRSGQDAAPEGARRASSNGCAPGAKARQAKSKARISAYEEMARRRTKRESVETAQIIIPAGPRLGDDVIEVEDLHQGASATSC